VAEPAETNLTRDQKLVKSSPGLNPVPNHYLVIYKQARAGWTLRECLPPGKRPRRLPFESPADFITYAVVADRELRHQFERDYRSHDQVHSFTLDLTVEYRVSAPTALVEGLELDPLRRLEKEISNVVVQATKGLDWTFIEREHIDLEQLLFGATGNAAGLQPTSHLDKLRRFAAGVGFEVYRIAIARRLPAKEVVVPAQLNLETQKRQVAVLQQGTDELKKTLQHRTGQLAQALSQDLAARGKQFGRSEKLADTVADGTALVLGREIDAARSLSELGSTLQQVPGLYSTLRGGAGTAPHLLGASPPVDDAGGAPRALLGPGHDAGSPLAVLLADLGSHFGSAADDPALRSQILPAALHLLAEVLRGAGAEALAEHAGAVQRLLGSCLNLLDRDQIQLLKRLQGTAALRAELEIS